MEEKPFYQSLTFWFNVLFGLVAVAGSFGFEAFRPSQEAQEIALVVVSIINLLLRFRTKSAIK